MKIGARSTPLSRAQVEEAKREFGLQGPVLWVQTRGDLEQTTSLRNMGSTNFFTDVLDEMLLRGDIDLAIHSAKDLPDPLPQGLKLAALSKGLDPRDSLVYKGAVQVVATSSIRREESVKKLYPKARFVDLRGPIHARLAKVGQEVDGVVVAECALIRLHLTHLRRVILPGETAPLQGKIAIVCREHEEIVFRP